MGWLCCLRLGTSGWTSGWDVPGWETLRSRPGLCRAERPVVQQLDFCLKISVLISLHAAERASAWHGPSPEDS